jgi:DNA polymerase elongation subunit (family B)
LDGSDISKDNLRKLLDDTRCSIASNGVLYRQDKVGCIPDILDHWFSQRVEFRKLEKKYGHEGDTEKYEFYKKRQLVQKILLNSLYGVLGLQAFRFYNIANAEAVTITGQTVIKRTADIANVKYNKELGGSILTVIMEDDSQVELYPNSLVMVKRSGVQLTIPAKELKEDDDFIGKVGI